MSKPFFVAGSYCRGSAPTSVLPGPRHENRLRLLRVAAFECGLDVIPRWLRGEERAPIEIEEKR